MATIQDSLADTDVLAAGSGITIAQASPGDPVVITSTGGYTDEQVRDVVGAALVAGSGVTITVDDAGNTITIVASGTTDPEVVRDTMATALVAGTNVTITPNDGADTITIAAATDAEVVRDTIATALVAGTNVTITPNDGADTITIAATGSGGALVLDDLTDVDTTGVADGDTIAYDSGTSTWLPAAPSGGGSTGDSSWTNATYAGTWGSYGTPYAAAGYRKDGQGFVHLRGLVAGGSGTIFTLPTGYRRGAKGSYNTFNNVGTGTIDINTDGTVTLAAGGSSYASLDGITFYAES